MTPDTPTQAAALPPLPEPAIEDHPAELWGQNVLHDLFTADQMRAYAQQALQEACAERDALREAKENEVAALALLARMRQACGDDGARMQDELEQYLRGLRVDAVRYRWLARKVSAHGICDGWQFGFPTALTLPAPALAMRDPQAALGLAIDTASKEGA